MTGRVSSLLPTNCKAALRHGSFVSSGPGSLFDSVFITSPCCGKHATSGATQPTISWDLVCRNCGCTLPTNTAMGAAPSAPSKASEADKILSEGSRTASKPRIASLLALSAAPRSQSRPKRDFQDAIPPRPKQVVRMPWRGRAFLADYLRARVIHLLGAAICWLIASLIWMIRVVPKVRISEED